MAVRRFKPSAAHSGGSAHVREARRTDFGRRGRGETGWGVQPKPLMIAAGILALLGSGPCWGLDKDVRKKLDKQIRNLRHLKLPKGKRAGWKDVLKARGPMLEALQYIPGTV